MKLSLVQCGGLMTYAEAFQVLKGTLKFINGNYRHVITPLLHMEWNSFH